MRVTFLTRLSFFKALMLALAFSPVALAQSPTAELNARLVTATNAFVASLDASQREQAQYSFADDERLNWHFIPRPRNGIPLKSLNAAQRELAMGLVEAFLGDKGFAKSEQIRGLENVLAAIEVNGRFVRDPELYYLTVFGTPGPDSDWAFRYEGHHQAFNWTFVGGQGIASTPQFFGSNPAEVREGPQLGLRVLATEEDLARELVTSLNADQARRAILEGQAPNDIYTGANKEVSPLEASGIRYATLNGAQQGLLMQLIEEVAATQDARIAEQRLATIRAAGVDHIQFAWIGSTERGDPHYYRIQGQGFLIEYDNTQNEANHIHLVWRDFDGDFGRDLIRMHYDAVAADFGSGHRH